MSALTTKADIYDQTHVSKVRIWKSLALATGDTLATGLKSIWSVSTAKPASVTSWTASAGVITFTLGASITGPVVVIGR
jgi:hypothetical protein